MQGVEPATRPGALRRAASGLAFAVSFLTIVPFGDREWDEGDLRRSAAWMPLVGALVGAVAGGVRIACEPALGATVSSVLAIVALVVLTGAFHQDALADMADGLGARGGRERRLTAMRDPAVGVFGALAIALWTLLMATALAGLDNEEAFAALLAAAATGRWAAVLHAALAPPARPEGLGAAFGVGPFELLTASLFAALAAGLACGPLPGIGALVAAGLAAAGTALIARRVFGGRTGDTIGASVAIAEVAVCVVLLGAAGV